MKQRNFLNVHLLMTLSLNSTCHNDKESLVTSKKGSGKSKMGACNSLLTIYRSPQKTCNLTAKNCICSMLKEIIWSCVHCNRLTPHLMPQVSRDRLPATLCMISCLTYNRQIDIVFRFSLQVLLFLCSPGRNANTNREF